MLRVIFEHLPIPQSHQRIMHDKVFFVHLHLSMPRNLHLSRLNQMAYIAKTGL